MFVAKVLLLRQRHADVACVLHHVSQRFQFGFQSGHAHRRRPHVHAAPLLP